MERKALVVAPQPFFTPRGTPFSVYYRTLVMAELGVHVDLLTYGQGEDVDIPNVRIIRAPAFMRLGSVTVGPSALKVLHDLALALRALTLLCTNHYDIVHAHEEAVFFCRLFKRMFGYRLIYDMHSSLPQQLVNFHFTRSRWLIRLFERLEHACLAEADAVITICPDLAEYAVSRSVRHDRHVLIENSIFEPVRLRAEDHNGNGEHRACVSPTPVPPGRAVVAYAGTFEPYQGLDILIRAFAEVRRSRRDALLLLVGGTADQVARYRAFADQCRLNGDCVLTGQVAPSVARSYTQQAAVLVSPRSAGTNTPLKVYEQLASGIPLVATRIHSHTQVLDDSVCFLVDPEPDAMAAGILAAMNGPRRRAEMARNAEALYRTKYSRDAYTRKMRRLLEMVF